MNEITSSRAQGILAQKTVIHEKEEAKETSLAMTSAHDRMVPDYDAGRGNRKGFWEGSGFWVQHTETTKCRKRKAARVLEFSTEYQWHGGGYPSSCRGLSSEGTLRKRPLDQWTELYLLLLQSFADQKNQKSQGIGSSTQECPAWFSQGNQPYMICTHVGNQKSRTPQSRLSPNVT